MDHGGANNESEALRAWKSALDTIYYHNAHKVPLTYVPKNDTERGLQDALRELELQCKERVSLLETLRESRKEAGMDPDPKTTPISKGKLEKSRPPVTGPQKLGGSTTGWIGGGTIPSISYPELSRPPALPPRPTMHSQSSLNSMTQTPQSSSSDVRGLGLDSLPSPPILPVPSSRDDMHRQANPEKKKTLLTTLRGKDSKSSSGSSTPPRKHSRPAASKAAGLAWSFVTHSGSSKNAQASSGNESAPSTPRKSTSSDSGSRRDALPSRHSIEETPMSTRGAYRSDYFSGPPLTRRISGDHAAASLAAGAAAAAAAAQRPTEGESHNGFLDPSPDLKANPFDKWKQSDTKQDTGYSPTQNGNHRPPISTRSSTVELPRSIPVSTNPQTRTNKAVLDDAGQRRVVKTNSAPSKPRPNGKDVIRDVETNGEDSPTDGRARHLASQTPVTAQRPVVGQQRVVSKSNRLSVDTPSQEEVRNVDEDEDALTNELGYDQSFGGVMSNLPKGVDREAAKQILNEIVVRGDEVHWDDVAGLEPAKKALKEAVVYPFLRPDLFMGLREPARGMLLFGPPGTGKTMLARAVATESKSTFFSVSASSLTSKWHGESEKLVRALFVLAKVLAPSIIFVDEIDSLLSCRSKAGEAEASRRLKTEFLIQWSDLQRAAAGREQSEKEKKLGDATRVLVLAATNMPWDIDDAARRRFVRRQYIPLPEAEVRKLQFQKLLSHQKHELSDDDINVIVKVTDGFSGSDITALAKDAAMGPLRNLGEDLLQTPMEQIPPITFGDFEASLYSIRPSVNKEGLSRYEAWAKDFGERGG
ncbi:uncharacterized protein GIQ15_00103 [Arthroderma uncinatum]|uniref:uncharacterized protein n=1 Tax=Arthroderma uncinatum TaxID=74035 RepID=UPI00144AA32C|nr:uncharacterized protein GIQ15_00103 [Arthroderma uncinatum]KAF3490586.1 hypothetical protein GIQ15_00103 [Arthroderma uncinatum]